MLRHLVDRDDRAAVPITAVTKTGLEDWLARQDDRTVGWLSATDFKAEPGAIALLPAADGALAGVLLGIEDGGDNWSHGGLPFTLPAGTYRLDGDGDGDAAALAWALGGYRFGRYSAAPREPAQLVWPQRADRAAVERAASATFLVRDLVNMPAGDMGPGDLAAAAEQLAGEFDARIAVLTGDELLANNYPAIHAVGRASARAPRLIDLTWGPPDAPKVTVVGKGVCFDSGGLDLKPSRGMLIMKKDMGGGAHALGLARMVMMANLPVRLRMLVPAVENMVAGNAFKPLDVLPTRKGLTVEVGNTDAEGRLVLCDALAEADDQNPALLLDFATLTGAARVALGAELPAMFCNDEATSRALLAAAEGAADPLWRLPLWRPYAKELKSTVADLGNVGEGGLAGAITAALFLQRFVSDSTPWVHLDIFAWNLADRPGRPKGGEAMALRAAFALIENRFGAD
ncbi:MAG: leucyl aminopeptidase family protein [Alphaproteobacteria bacterium]